MFSHIQTGNTLSKTDYEKRVPHLRYVLLQLQQELKQQHKSLLIIVSGVEGAGKGALVNRLNEWMDVRLIQTHVFHDFTDEERARPEFWRYWRVMPQSGSTAIFWFVVHPSDNSTCTAYYQ